MCILNTRDILGHVYMKQIDAGERAKKRKGGNRLSFHFLRMRPNVADRILRKRKLSHIIFNLSISFPHFSSEISTQHLSAVLSVLLCICDISF